MFSFVVSVTTGFFEVVFDSAPLEKNNSEPLGSHSHPEERTNADYRKCCITTFLSYQVIFCGSPQTAQILGDVYLVDLH